MITNTNMGKEEEESLHLHLLIKDGNEAYPVEVLCEICADSKVSTDMFRVSNGCSHSFCCDCISKHVSAKVHENVTVIQCPGLECVSVLDMENCKGVVPEDLAIRWARVSCEAMFLESQKFYCPFKSCSAMLIKDCDDEKKVRECECPHCHRLFCADCRMPWHAGVTCGEYRALGEDERGREDLMVRELALVNNWRRCPKCKFYVERLMDVLILPAGELTDLSIFFIPTDVSGSSKHSLDRVHRCQFQFCYGCGAAWDEKHGGCERD